MDKLALKQAIYYGSYLVFPFAAYFVIRLSRGARHRWIAIVALCCALLFGWARFVEPQIITVRQHHARIGFPAKLALIADLHMGVYKRAPFLERLVDKLNALDVDFVLIAGDFIEEPEGPLPELFAPFRKLRHKAYAVRGNHDSGAPGPPVEKELRAALTDVGVTLIENDAVRLGNFVLVGLGDRWANNDRVDTLKAFRASDNVIVLTHNPDTALLLPPGIADLTLAGHTHGGQIRIPWLYRAALPTDGPFDRGWYELPTTRLFVTTGVGENALPMRFLVPPVIDVLVLD
ncbi:MAG TPA: metallophosphoesterase [Burkholderiales bacterium]|nr:metallophosphoesterase [Burkholderiales bacterium]